MAKSTSDKKLDRDLLKLAEKGQLADFIVDLLIEADRPEIELDGGSVVLRQAPSRRQPIRAVTRNA